VLVLHNAVLSVGKVGIYFCIWGGPLTCTDTGKRAGRVFSRAFLPLLTCSGCELYPLPAVHSGPGFWVLYLCFNSLDHTCKNPPMRLWGSVLSWAAGGGEALSLSLRAGAARLDHSSETEVGRWTRSRLPSCTHFVNDTLCIAFWIPETATRNSSTAFHPQSKQKKQDQPAAKLRCQHRHINKSKDIQDQVFVIYEQLLHPRRVLREKAAPRHAGARTVAAAAAAYTCRCRFRALHLPLGELTTNKNQTPAARTAHNKI
jgi:hypothetical protein